MLHSICDGFARSNQSRSAGRTYQQNSLRSKLRPHKQATLDDKVEGWHGRWKQLEGRHDLNRATTGVGHASRRVENGGCLETRRVLRMRGATDGETVRLAHEDEDEGTGLDTDGMARLYGTVRR